jgi:hypothetical protein
MNISGRFPNSLPIKRLADDLVVGRIENALISFGVEHRNALPERPQQ